jgi:hypothetical protein
MPLATLYVAASYPRLTSALEGPREPRRVEAALAVTVPSTL